MILERVNFVSRWRLFSGIAAVLAAVAVLISGAPEVRAASSPWWQTDQGAVRLVAASDAAGTGGILRFGLHFRMHPGWKIYWRSPGDAGFAPQTNWAGSQNFAEASVQWPTPERFSVIGLETLGYKKEVVLPLTVSVFEPGKPVSLRAMVRYLTCAEICVPYNAMLALDIPAGPETNSRETALIDRFAALVPATGDGGGLRIDRADIAGAAPDQTIQVALAADAPMTRTDVFVEGPPGFGFGAPRVRIDAGGRGALMRIPVSPPRGTGADLAGETVTLTLVSGARAIERRVELSPATSAWAPSVSPAPVFSAVAFAAILGFALLGGLILNIMPCVLPVLSIKLLTVVAHGGGDPRPVRTGFLASAAGILVSFAVLATGAVLLKQSGLAAGWGIQFQQPLFLAAMVMILVLFAGNLWGLFEFHLPGAVADGAAGAGHGHGLGGHFLTGAFATLLATPCSAPFLGTAVGFALSRGPLEIYAVFAALGLGLALPYLAVAAFPGLATRLPRPGPWMVTLRYVLGLALIATAAWLVTVLATQTSFAVGGLVTLLIAAALVALWQLRGLSGRARGATWGVVGALSVLALVISASLTRPDADVDVAVIEDGVWQPFDRAQIDREVAAGRIVFVDVTADWCLTCQVNKALVLNIGAVRDRLGSDNVVAMKADWTRPDPRITRFLADFGRYGIPFNVVYGPGAPEGVPLPEILTEGKVLAGFQRAGGRSGKVRITGR